MTVGRIRLSLALGLALLQMQTAVVRPANSAFDRILGRPGNKCVHKRSGESEQVLLGHIERFAVSNGTVIR